MFLQCGGDIPMGDQGLQINPPLGNESDGKGVVPRLLKHVKCDEADEGGFSYSITE